MGILFLLSPALIPLIEIVPAEATAPCLVLVGTMMMAPIEDINFKNFGQALPAFLIICVTPLAYSISAGIFVGLVAYIILGTILRFTEAATSCADMCVEAFRTV